MLTKDKIMQIIGQNRNKIKSFGVKKLTLFGSYAHKTARQKSDVDFLVEFEPERGLFDDYVHLHQFLEDLLDKKIDLGETHLLREELKEDILGGQKVETAI